MSAQLLDQVRLLLYRARQEFTAGETAANELDDALAKLDGPLKVALAGKVKAGKSTLLNALVRERLAPTDAGECTRVVSVYEKGLTYRVSARLHDGTARTVRFRRDEGSLEIDLGDLRPEAIERLVIEWPSSSLERLTLIDTPGIASLSADASARAVRYLAPDDERATEADAVIYLMRHLHNADRRFLEAFHDQELSQASPVNTVAVLSRADEIGVARLDAMASARRIAERYRNDPQIRRLCQTVVPVAGLIAEAGGTLRQDEYQAFARLAAAPRNEVDRLLVSVDRFANDPDGCGLLPAEREHLLVRFGLFGVRLSVALLRNGVVVSAPGLASELASRSGIEDLRTVLDTLFAERRTVLKARGGVLRLRAVLDAANRPNEEVESRFEQIWANAHEIAELRLLNGLRSRQVQFEADVEEQLERVIGAHGHSVDRRLGLSASESRDAAGVRARALALIGEWRRLDSHPLTTRDQRDALEVAVRSAEQIVAGHS